MEDGGLQVQACEEELILLSFRMNSEEEYFTGSAKERISSAREKRTNLAFIVEK